MMNFHFHIFEAIYKLKLAIKCSKKIFQDAYKRLTSTGVHILFSSIYIALGWALCVFLYLFHNEIKYRLNKQV